MKSIAFFQFSTEEDLSYVLEFSGLDLTGRDFEIKVTERASNTTKATLTNGSGITVTGSNVLEAAFAKGGMVGWSRGEYSADVVDITDGAHSRIMAVRFVLDLPGRLVQGVQNRKAFVQWSPNQAVVTATGAIGPAGPRGPIGEGWSPLFSIANDGNRRVLRVVDWTGGTGDKPTTGLYVGATGLVANIADGADVRGVQGLKGDQGDIGDQGPQGQKGWSPKLVMVPDGARRVLRIVDWLGGAGVKPATGSYLGDTDLVTDVADATDFRGPAGSVVPPGSIDADDLADHAVPFAKMQEISANVLLGRGSGTAGDIQEKNAAEALAILGVTSPGTDLITALSKAAQRAALQITAAGDTLILASDTGTQRAALGVAAQVAAKSGAYSVVANDYGKSFAAAGTWTFGLLAAATAGTDFWVEIRNTGTGRITIDPNGAETVNGATTLRLYRGESVKLVCDATGWHALFLSSYALLDAGSPLGAAVSVVDLALPDEFRSFDLHVENFEPSAGAALGARFSVDGGATYYSSSGNYQWNQAYTSVSTTYAQSYGSGGSSIFGTTGIELSSGFVSAAAGNAVGADIQIRPGRAGCYPSLQYQFQAPGYCNFGSGYLGVTGRVTNARLVFSGTAQIGAGSSFELRGRR